MKKIFVLAVLDFLLSLALIILFYNAIYTNPELYYAGVEVNSNLDSFNKIAGNDYDLKNYDDLVAFNESLGEIKNLEQANSRFLKTFLRIVLIFCLLATMIKTFEYKFLMGTSFFKLFWKILITNIILLIGSGIFLSIMVSFTAIIGITAPVVTKIVMILWYILFTYCSLAAYTYVASNKFYWKRLFMVHSAFLLFLFIYIYLAIKLITFLGMNLVPVLFIPFIIFLFFLVYLVHLVKVKEQEIMTKTKFKVRVLNFLDVWR